MQNASSEIGSLYGDFNFNKAPSFKQNVSDIRNMIKKRKIHKAKYLDNLFYSSITGNKDSLTNFDDNYESRKKEIEFLSQNLYNRNKPMRNNSCIEFKKSFFKDKDILLLSNKNTNTNSNKNINLKAYRFTNSGCVSTTTYKTINTNKLHDLSKDNIKCNLNSCKEKSKNNIYSKTTKDFAYLPNISAQKKINDNKSSSTIIRNNNSFLTNLNTEQMDFIINDCIFESKTGIKNVNEFEKKIYQMKLFQGFQRKKLNYLYNREIYSVQKYIKHIEKSANEYSKISKEYDNNYQEYLRYLRELISDMDSELKDITNKHIQLEYDIDNLLHKIIDKQIELEKLIDMRNFLFRVKHKDEKIPKSDIYATFYIESKRFFLGDCLSKLFKDDNNITVIKYMNDLAEIKQNEESIDDSKYIVKNSPPLIADNYYTILFSNDSKNKNKNKKRRNNLAKESQQMLEMIRKNVFSEPEEIIKTLKYLEDQNRFLLKQNENKRLLIEKYKSDLENCMPQEDIKIENNLISEILVKERELSKLKEKNNMLKQKYNYFYQRNIKNVVFEKGNKKRKKSEAGKSSFADLHYFQSVFYNTQIKRAKYPGMILFGKLIKYFLNFLSMNYDCFTKEKFYTHISKDHLNEILEYSEIMDFNEKNYFLIYRYIIKLLKLYEYICDYVFKKNIEYNSNEKNKPIIKRENDKIGEKRKLDNARTIRLLIENKRIEGNKQLIEKWQKPEKYICRKIDNNNYKLLLKNKSQDDILKKTKTKKKYNTGIDDEFNGLVHYNE